QVPVIGLLQPGEAGGVQPGGGGGGGMAGGHALLQKFNNVFAHRFPSPVVLFPFYRKCLPGASCKKGNFRLYWDGGGGGPFLAPPRILWNTWEGGAAMNGKNKA